MALNIPLYEALKGQVYDIAQVVTIRATLKPRLKDIEIYTI